MQLPSEFQYLTKIEEPPLMLSQALLMFGLRETPGPADNELIMKMAVETGLYNQYKHDSTAWCGLFMAAMAVRSDKDLPPDPLWALNWMKFGQKADKPSIGDAMIFERVGGGHVGLYAGETKTNWIVLGGNQSDMVKISFFAKHSAAMPLAGARRPIWRYSQPKGVKPMLVNLKNGVYAPDTVT